MSLLTNDLSVQSAVDQDGLTDLLGLVGIQEVAAAVSELLLHCVINSLMSDNGLLGSADHTVIEGLGVDDGVNSHHNIGGVVDDSGGVTGANAQSRLTGRISSLHHAGATGGQDDVSASHNLVGQFQRGHVDPCDDVLGSAGCNSSVQNNLSSSDGALLGTGMGADDDTVAGLQRNQSLEDSGRSGVGGGDNSSNHTDGLSDLGHAESGVILQHAAGLGILVLVVDILGSIVVLGDLVFHDAHAGLFHSHLGQRNTSLVCSDSSCKEDLVNLLLSEGREDSLSFSYLCHLGNQCINIVYQAGGSGFGGYYLVFFLHLPVLHFVNKQFVKIDCCH